MAKATRFRSGLFVRIHLVGGERRLAEPAYAQHENVVTAGSKYDSVATTSVRVENFLLDVFREQIIFGRLSGDIDLFSESACCLLEGTPPRQSNLRASCENPTVDVFSVTFGTGQDDNPMDHPVSPRRCRSRNSPMKSARLRPSCHRASCKEARMAAASSAEGCDDCHSSTNSSRLVALCEWRSLSAAKTANWRRFSSSVAGIQKTPISIAVFALSRQPIRTVALGKINSHKAVRLFSVRSACCTSSRSGGKSGREAGNAHRDVVPAYFWKC